MRTFSNWFSTSAEIWDQSPKTKPPLIWNHVNMCRRSQIRPESSCRELLDKQDGSQGMSTSCLQRLRTGRGSAGTVPVYMGLRRLKTQDTLDMRSIIHCPFGASFVEILKNGRDGKTRTTLCTKHVNNSPQCECFSVHTTWGSSQSKPGARCARLSSSPIRKTNVFWYPMQGVKLALRGFSKKIKRLYF